MNNVKNVRYNAHGTIDCEVEHPQYGWIPFTASPEDAVAEGRLIYEKAIEGAYGEISPYVPDPNEPSPLELWRGEMQVSRFQARAALLQAGLLEDIESYMNDPETDPFVKVAWQDAQVFRRQSPTVLGLQHILELTDEQLDDLFRFAATIEA